MEVVLEAIAGPIEGKRITVEFGQVLSFGRTNKADMALGDDFMSGVHFAVEFGPSGCRVIDKGSRNGTFLNESQVSDAFVANGDKIRAGQTTLLVQFSRATAAPAAPAPQPSAYQAPAAAPSYSAPAAAPSYQPGVPYVPPAAPARAVAPPTPAAPAYVPPAPPRPVASFQRRPAVLSIGSWSFSRIPDGWEAQEGFGIQQKAKNGFPSNIVVTEEQLAEGASLQQFVEAQVNMLRQYLRQPSIEAALPPGVPGAEESVAIDVKYSTKEGDVVMYKRIYARAGSAVGVLTLTVLEKDLQSVLPAFRELMDETGFYPSISQ